MKKIFTFLVAIALLFSATSLNAQVNVTFNVDANAFVGFDAATDEIYMAGTIFSPAWQTPGSDANTKMTDLDTDGIYTLTVPAVAAGDYEFKYFRVISGASSWDNGEWAGGDNRVITVADVDLTFDHVFGDITASVPQINAVDFSVSPNPSNGVFSIVSEKSSTMEVLNITGQLVYTQRIEAGNNAINLASIQSGVYFVKLSEGNAVQIRKIVIQ